jgi:hypothetical protein
MLATTWLQGFFSCHFFIVDLPAGPTVNGILTPLVVCVACLVYKFGLAFRRCLQAQYSGEGAALEVSRRMVRELIGVFPVVFVLTLDMASGLSQLAATVDEHAAHTPHCTHTPHLGFYNSAFRCAQDPVRFPFSFSHGISWLLQHVGNIDHIEGHAVSGIASFALFLSPTACSTFEDAVERAIILEGSPPVTTATAFLTEHDYRRFSAVEDHDEGLRNFAVAGTQAPVFITSLFASQILARGSRTLMDDLLQSRVTKVEFGAIACTAANILLVLLMGSLKGRALSFTNLFAITCSAGVIMVAQLGCLYKVCSDIGRGRHIFHSVRAPRLSAVVPQPAGTAVWLGWACLTKKVQSP